MGHFGYQLCKNTGADRLRVCSELGLGSDQLPVVKKTQNWLDAAAIARFSLDTDEGRDAYAALWARVNVRLTYAFETALGTAEFDLSSDDEA